MARILLLSPILISLFCLIGCKELNPSEKYLRWVGDIEFNPALDDPEFYPCNGEEQVLQYFNLEAGPQFPGEKPALEQLFKSQYAADSIAGQSGWIRLRFMVNCKGKAGRFRLLEANSSMVAFQFDSSISEQLMSITKSIKEWPILYRDQKAIDYYFYLTFKLKDAQIQEILP